MERRLEEEVVGDLDDDVLLQEVGHVERERVAFNKDELEDVGSAGDVEAGLVHVGATEARVHAVSDGPVGDKALEAAVLLVSVDVAKGHGDVAVLSALVEPDGDFVGDEGDRESTVTIEGEGVGEGAHVAAMSCRRGVMIFLSKKFKFSP